jgi:methionyl-tRNA synthetase
LDALTNYISALNYPDTDNDLYKSFWPADVHIIGKDILRFHAVYWPAFLLAANIPLPKRIYGHGWILSGDEKMSKSKGNILDPLEIIDSYGIDPLRYYLVKEVSFGNDGNISRDKLEDCINSDLANNFGNFCQRVTAFNEKNCDLRIPEYDKFQEEDDKILNNFTDNIENLRKFIDDQKLNLYVDFIINALFDANKYFNDQEPWKKKNDKKRLNTIVFVALELIRKISIMLYPIVPSSSIKSLSIFNINEKDISFETIKDHKHLKSNSKITKIEILFKKIIK